MLSVQRLEDRNVVPSLSGVAKMIAAIGRDEFARVALDALDEAIGIDHLSVFRIGANGSIDYHEATSVGGAHISENAARQYFHRFNRLDPVRSVSGLRSGLGRGSGLLVHNRADDISDPLYRRECYVVPEIGERLALYASVDRRIFQINVYRRTTRQGFDEAAVDTLAKMATVLLPSAARHAEFITGRDDQDGLRLSLVALKHRVEMLGCGLSVRELEVCARALFGQSIEGTSLELQIARTSVVTYRRRAFAKLHISCCNELFALAFRSE
jgi:LuxR family transcriptional regulator, activator of tox operons